MFSKVVVANRGAVAARVLRALDSLGIASVAAYSDADADAPYLELATQTVRIGPAAARDSYLNVQALLDALRETGADALHPGYGFLSENAAFAEQVESSGARFIGPSPRWIGAMGHKTRARALAAQYGWPLAPGSSVLGPHRDAVLAAAAKIGYPVLVKPAAGGGGIGMLPARCADELLVAVERASSMAQRGFGSGEVYLERLIDRPRHVEVQVLGDRCGQVMHLYERDCSTQRRHQKLIEEAPAPAVDRAAVESLSQRLAQTLASMGYDNIGTVEMLLGADGQFGFLEMNTRLQVEHGVTEEVTGVDLVVAQIRSAAGEPLATILPRPPALRGHAIQARVYAEDPKRFLPSPGTLRIFRPPQHAAIRIETGYREGQQVTPHYDPLLAKVIVHAPTRMQAIGLLTDALRGFEIDGVRNNVPALLEILQSAQFIEGRVDTGIVSDVLAAGR